MEGCAAPMISAKASRPSRPSARRISKGAKHYPRALDGTAMSSQPCGVTVARSPGRSSTVVVADSTIAGPAIVGAGRRGWRCGGQVRRLRQLEEDARNRDPRIDEHRLLVGHRISVERLVA